jgi:hypothetical protein
VKDISDAFNVHDAQAVEGNGGVDYLWEVSLDHAQIFKVPLVLGQLNQILQEVDDVGPDIDVILILSKSAWTMTVRVPTFSSCSRMHEWKSSASSRCFSANPTTSSALSSQGLRAFRRFENMRRSSNGSDIAEAAPHRLSAEMVDKEGRMKLLYSSSSTTATDVSGRRPPRINVQQLFVKGSDRKCDGDDVEPNRGTIDLVLPPAVILVLCTCYFRLSLCLTAAASPKINSGQHGPNVPTMGGNTMDAILS